MDFVFSSDPRDLVRVKEVVGLVDKKIRIFSGPWGVLVTTPTPFLGLEPVEDDDHIALVLGDPLIGPIGLNNPKVDPSCRTRRLLKEIKSHSRIQAPEHVSSVLVIDKNSREIEITTDLSGLMEIYHHHSEDRTLLSTSTTLLAKLCYCAIDRISMLQLLASGYVSPPYTNFVGVRALALASHIRIVGSKVDSHKWWQPKPPLHVTTSKEANAYLEEALSHAMGLVGRHIGRDGYTTLSAGLDSRFVAKFAKDSGLLVLSAVSLVTGDTANARAVTELAQTVGMPLKSVLRPVDFYSRTILEFPPSYSLMSSLDDAHFHGAALGDEIGPFLLGAYRADTLLVRADSITLRRSQSIARGEIPPNAPTWACNALYLDFHEDDVQILNERSNKVATDLGLPKDHPNVRNRTLVHGRSGAYAHVASAFRAYPMYELFQFRAVIEACYDLAAVPLDQLSLEEKEAAHPKLFFYGPRIADLAHIPVNPSQDPNYRHSIEQSKVSHPKSKWSDDALFPSDWSERPGPYNTRLKEKANEARPFLEQEFSVKLPKRMVNPNLAILVAMADLLQQHGSGVLQSNLEA